MTAPPPPEYERTFGFTQYQGLNPTLPAPGAQIDGEMDRISASINATIAALADVRRADGLISNETVTVDSLTYTARALMGAWNPRGVWLTSQSYSPRDMVMAADGKTYVCVTAHTSGVFNTDVSNGRWTSIFGTDVTLASNTVTLASGASTTRSFGARFSDVANVLDFGADATGAADSRAAFQAALDTGKSVVVPPGHYRLNSGVSFASDWQTIDLTGSRLLPYGSFNLFTCTGGRQGCKILGLTVDASNMTGSSHILYISNADRFLMSDFIILNPRNAVYVEKANYTVLRNGWVNNILGSYGLKWYGNDALRSDVLWLSGWTSSSNTARAAGIIQDGNCHTLIGEHVNLTWHGYGFRVLNTNGVASYPEFAFFDRMMIDFPTEHAVSLEAGGAYWFDHFYAHGGAKSGIYVGASVRSDSTIIQGGKITNFTRYGIESAGPAVLGQNSEMVNNVMGNISAGFAVKTMPLGVSSGGAFSLLLDSGLYPTLSWASGSFRVFVPASNIERQVINGSTIEEAYSDRKAFYVPVRLPGYTVAGLPSAAAFNSYIIRVSDRNNRLATSDGISWRWVGDGAVVS